MSEQEKSGAIVTSCRDCVFARYEGNEQVDCDWDRLDKFEANGAAVVGHDDGFLRYFMVVGRFCNACRHKDTWGREHPAGEWADIVAGECEVRVHFLIYADAEHTIEDVGNTLDSVLGQQGFRPTGVTIVLNGVSEETREYLKLIRKREVPFHWEVRQIAADEQGTQPPYGRAIDLATVSIPKETRATYYGVARAGYVWPVNYLEVINVSLNQEMIRCVALLPDDAGNGLLMSLSLHNHLLSGNNVKPILEKLFEVAEEEQTGHMIRSWEDLATCV